MPKTCRCGNGPANIILIYDKPTRRGMSRYHTAPKDMRCADKEAFAVMEHGVSFVKAERKEVSN